ncbi:SGNH/GDSL hydrolase family protein [Streptomyces olivaceus]|uniref:SGNH/GDSL hydrolase family protein n=1 Tax=Streptomyces olivaceus TaxID=47716 RepID=UPI0036E3D906
MRSHRLPPGRRTVLAGGLILLTAKPALAADRNSGSGSVWTGIWAAAPTGAPASADVAFEDQTLRQVVHTSIAGDRLRVRLTNEFGDEPLVIGEAHLARRATGGSGAGTEPGSDRVLRFGGRTSLTLTAGTARWSDPVPLRVPADSDLVVSVHLPRRTRATTVHSDAHQHAYVAAGNVTGEPDVEVVSTNTSWHFLSGVAADTARAGRHSGAVAILGSSTTDGTGSTADANRRWPDQFARRLRESPRRGPLGVLNGGLGGNRLLHDANPIPGTPAEEFAAYHGESGLNRFDRDVLDQPGLRYAVVALGINDILQPGLLAPADEEVTTAELIAGHRQLTARAHARGIRIFGATLTAFKGIVPPPDLPVEDIPDFEPLEAKRQGLNHWIRTTRAYDGLIDFDAATRDPGDPQRLNPEYDSGDHLHQNDAGMAAMAEAVPLRLFR